MTLKNNRAPLLTKLYASFHYHMWIQTGVTVRKLLSWIMTSVTLTFDLWPFAWTSLLSLVITPENFVIIQWQKHSETAVTDIWMDRGTDCQKEVFLELLGAAKNNRAHLLRNIKLYASVHHHTWIQTGVTVWKWLSWVVTFVTFIFDLWPWPVAWTLPWSLVTTPENFMMIWWWEHSQKGVTDRQTDRQTNRKYHS